MKNIYSFIIALFSFLSLQGQVYVDINANGNNDGSSWENAYTDLSMAAQNASSGSELWIAAGLYTLNETLMLDESGIDLYGGFGGIESSPSQRSFSSSTIISGDVNGDDIVGDFETNSEDNLVHVLFIRDSEPRVIDGLTVEGARGDLEAEDYTDPGDGGGLLAHGTIDIRNCVFRYNQNRWGGGILLTHTPEIPGIYHISDCIIENNRAVRFGGGIYGGFGGSYIEIDNCDFIDNACRNAAGLYVGGATVRNDVFINNCRFRDNNAVNGGGLMVQSNAVAEVTNCYFDDNAAIQGGGTTVNTGGTVTFSSCIWDGNSAFSGEFAGIGGAVMIDESAFPTFIDCDFVNNYGEDAGGGLGILNFANGPNNVQIINSLFADNFSDNWGGAIYAQQPSNVSISDAVFEFNSAVEGGAIFTNDETNFDISNSIFADNFASWGGAILSNYDLDIMNVSNSIFKQNFAAVQGGAYYNFRGAEFNFNNNLFDANESGDWGGAIYTLGFDSNNEGSINACQFISNYSFASAGAIFHENGNLYISNSEFNDNMAFDFGVGNSISTNQSDETPDRLRLVNNTFHEDAAGLGAITQWAGSSLTSIVEAQNNVFSGEGTHWAVEAGDGTFISKGGNLSSSEDMEDVLTNDTDLNSSDPKFSDVAIRDFSLMEGSPCIDGGLAPGAPVDDIQGILRDAIPDRGAYEYDNNCAPDGGNVILASGGMKYEACAGNVRFSMRNSSVSSLPYFYVITDAEDKILAYQSADNTTLDLSEAPSGECHIWGVNSNRPFIIEIGKSISDLNSEDCSEVSDNYVKIIRFSEEACNEPCHAPRNLRARTNSSKTHVRWSRVNDAKHYEIKIVYEDSEFEIVTLVSRNSIRISKSNKTYTLSVRAICGYGVVSDFSDEITIETEATNSVASAFSPTAPFTTNVINDIDAIVYPNPLQNVLNFQLNNIEGIGTLQIFDLMGVLKLEDEINLNEGISADISNLNDGMFILSIQSESGVIHQQRIVKSPE